MSNRQLQGFEQLHGGANADANSSILDFWRWAFGDLCHNNLRGVFAEWLVAQILGIALPPTRDPWAAYDLLYRDKVSIEVKCCGALQSWHKADQPSSVIGWSIPATRAWTAETGYAPEPAHNAALYILCAQIESDPEKWDALDLDQWRFHVLTRDQLAALASKRLSRARVLAGSPELTAEELKAAVDRLASA
jgi:hypothetical protein